MPRRSRKLSGALLPDTRQSFTQQSGQESAPGLCSTAPSITAAREQPAKAATSRSTITGRYAPAGSAGASKCWRQARRWHAGRESDSKPAASEARTLLSLAGGNPAAVTAEIVAKAWRDGDPLATTILEETADLLAIWLGNMIDLFDPDVIVVGGGMSELIARMVRAYPPADTEMVGQLAMGRNSLRSRTVRRGFRHSGRRGSVCLREGHLMTLPMLF